ncbi:hypothetical protein EB796_007208 [Bugula neritina]|uniref:Rho-GAP domain-containing protein n=1 Tax=Bugula neritina TaxID=10212 RepID=A0A7J7K8A0_BUGNE|nr:hypothetical protein EB796_007208 [Bugula neritina]
MAFSTNNRIWRTFTLGCASAPLSHTASQKLKFSVPLKVAFKHDSIPVPLLNLLKYISQDGVTTCDIFRRPGNTVDQRKIIKKLSEGRPVDFADYNFYTLASVIKRFLLCIPGGVFGAEGEETLLSVLEVENELEQYDIINRVVMSLPRSTQHFLALLFGVWFRVVNHIEFHSMSAEAMAKSVTGSIFQNCAGDPKRVTKAAKVMELMIDQFAITSIFGKANLQYFADVTCSGIVVTERFTYKYEYPVSQHSSVEHESSLRSFAQHLRKECSSRGLLLEDEEGQGDETSQVPDGTPSPLLPSQARRSMVGCMSVPDVNTSTKSHLSLNPNSLNRLTSQSLSKFETLQMRQMARLKKRSEWFLNSTNKSSPVYRQPNLTVTSESEANSSEHHFPSTADDSADVDVRSEAESVFEDRKSVDTVLLDKQISESCSTGTRDALMSQPFLTSDVSTHTLTRHFVKRTTIVPQTSPSVISC